MGLGLRVEVGGVRKKGIECIQAIQKVLIHHVEEIGQQKNLGEKGQIVHMLLSEKGGEFGGMGVEILPDTMLGVGLVGSLPEIATGERREEVSRGCSGGGGGGGGGGRLRGVKSDLEETLTEFGMNTTL